MSKKTSTNQLEVNDARVISFFSKDALSTLENQLHLPDGRPRYSDEILLAFEDILLKRISDKEKDIDRKQKNLLDKLLDKKSNKSYEDGDIGAEITQDEKIIDSDKKVLKEMRNALSRARHKTYGICWGTNRLIPLEQLLANPIAKFLTMNNIRCTG
tara:strand:+ start:116 stop:586 length:471 start_codon:yes stop_codon:yes gene_type:complete